MEGVVANGSHAVAQRDLLQVHARPEGVGTDRGDGVGYNRRNDIVFHGKHACRLTRAIVVNACYGVSDSVLLNFLRNHQMHCRFCRGIRPVGVGVDSDGVNAIIVVLEGQTVGALPPPTGFRRLRWYNSANR